MNKQTVNLSAPARPAASMGGEQGFSLAGRGRANFAAWLACGVSLLLVAGCASLPPIRWKSLGDTAPSTITAAVPATCPHAGAIWGPWSEITIGTLVKNSRVLECKACGWVQTQSEMKGSK